MARSWRVGGTAAARRRVAVAACAGVVAAAGAVACSSGGGPQTPPPPSAAAPPTTARPTAAEIADAVRVVDSGLTESPVRACASEGRDGCPPDRRGPDSDSLRYGSISYGFVIENTSDQVLTTLPVTYRFVDAEGQAITEPRVLFVDDDPTGNTETIPILRPGERVGVGGMTYPGRPGAAEVRVEIGVPGDWMPLASWESSHVFAQVREGDLTVSALHVRPGEYGEPVTTFTVESTYEAPVRALGVYAVYYDAGGRVIGGAKDEDGTDSIPAGGTAEAEIALVSPIEVPGIDPARTEVYYPGYPTTVRR
jgi:hypothetical protein